MRFPVRLMLFILIQIACTLAIIEILGVHAAVSRILWISLTMLVFSGFILVIFAQARISREAARSEAIAEYINDGLLFVDENSVAFANTLARKLLGGASSPPALTPELTKLLEETRRSHTPILYEASVDGRRRQFLVSRIHQPKRDNQIYVFQDVTFLHENEEAKVNFIGTLSHEIKTPITSLAMAIAMLERGGFDAELMKIANTDIARLRILLDDLLNVSKLKVVRDPNALQKRDTNLGALVQQAIKAATTLAEEKAIHLVSSNTARGKITANIDPTKISWVLSTLLTDAIRQTPAEKEIVARLEGEDGLASFSIEYERRLDSLGPTGHAIVRDIIEAHAGRFASLHRAGHRSVFRFTLHAHIKDFNTTKRMQFNEANLTG